MQILVSQLPSGGYGYDFAQISVSPMTFVQITEYLENCPSNDPLEKYLYDIKKLIDEDKHILDCYIMDVDFLIFYKKLSTISGDLSYNISVTCPECGKKVKKVVSLEKDIHFRQADEAIMRGANVVLNGKTYKTHVPTVREFFRVFEKYLKYRHTEDLKMIKTIALFEDFDLRGNEIENDVLGAMHSDITLLLALRDLYYDRLEKIELFCPECNADRKPEERRSITVSVEELTVDFFRDIVINCPIDVSKIQFKQKA